jgi:hypothetical protein
MARQVQQALWNRWRQRIQRQRDSGLSVADFCRRENVSSHSFYVWRCKLRQTARGRQGLPVEARRRQSARVPNQRRRTMVVAPPTRLRRCDFLQLPVAAAQPATWIELAMVDGTVLRLPQQNLAAMIAALRVLRGERLELPLGENPNA